MSEVIWVAIIGLISSVAGIILTAVLKPKNKTDTNEKPSPAHELRDGRQIILVVDDVQINRDMVKNILEKEYQIIEATNGREALFIVNGVIKPDIILLDVQMPVMDGYETMVELIKQGYADTIPVIFITAMDAEEHEARALNIGVADFISKPFNPNVLQAKVKKYIDLFAHLKYN